MVSIKDIAKEAGVSNSTVSKVLKGYPNISDKTKANVREAIRKLGYVPNMAASMLSSKQSGRIALLINPNTETQAVDEIYMQYILGAIRMAKEKRIDIITLFYSMIHEMTVEEITGYLKSQNIAGLIVCGMDRQCEQIMELVEGKQFKVVLIDAPIYNDSTSSIWIDNEKAQMDVVKATASNINCKSILYIAGEMESYVAIERLKGMKQYADEHHIILQIEEGCFSESKARELTFQFGKEHDLIACASDLMAIGAMKALTEMDVFHPVCGFDGITLMGYVGMQMNTVRQDFASISSAAVEELTKLMAGKEGKNIIMEHEIVRMKYEDIIC